MPCHTYHPHPMPSHTQHPHARAHAHATPSTLRPHTGGGRLQHRGQDAQAQRPVGGLHAAGHPAAAAARWLCTRACREARGHRRCQHYRGDGPAGTCDTWCVHQHQGHHARRPASCREIPRRAAGGRGSTGVSTGAAASCREALDALHSAEALGVRMGAPAGCWSMQHMTAETVGQQTLETVGQKALETARQKAQWQEYRR
eukprot:354234-Chlamydomonas_euryale.AAC.11